MGLNHWRDSGDDIEVGIERPRQAFGDAQSAHEQQ